MVDAKTAEGLKSGWLVVSVHLLMKPEWAWLRDQRRPTARVGYSLFAFDLSENRGQMNPRAP